MEQHYDKKLFMCELLNMYSSVRISKYDLFTGVPMLLFTILGQCVITYETVIQLSTYHLQVDTLPIYGIIP